MINVRDLHVGYAHAPVLHDINISVDYGEMAAILGPNGSGKTTLLLALSGVLTPQSGTITIDKKKLQDTSPQERAKTMACVPQRLEPLFDMRVMSLVLMGRYPYISFLGGYTPEDENIALEAMRSTRTEQFKDRLCGELSGGEFQRVVIARALAQEPELLLLDEAASGLDIARTIEIYDLLRAKNQQGLTLLTVVHDLNLAALYCRRLIFMKQGRVVLDGSTRDVFTEKNLTSIYDTPIKVYPHPVTGAPQGHVLPGHCVSHCSNNDASGEHSGTS